MTFHDLFPAHSHIPSIATTPGNNNASFLTFEFTFYADDTLGNHVEKSCSWTVFAGNEKNQNIGNKAVTEGMRCGS